MYDRALVIQVGSVASALSKAPLADARTMALHWSKFATLIGIVVNPQFNGPTTMQMININEVTPPLDEEMPLLYVLQLRGRDEPVDARPTEYWVAQWWRTVANEGLRGATIMYLNMLSPRWIYDINIAAAVAVLPGRTQVVVPGEPVLNIPLAPPTPNWDLSIGNGWLAIRVGDKSPKNTKCEHPTLGTWIKKIEPSMFSPDGGNGRWEKVPDPVSAQSNNMTIS